MKGMDQVLAVDIGGTKTAVGIVSARGIVLAKDTAPTPRGDPEAVRDCVAALAARVLGRAGPVESAGLALPGVVDHSRKLLLCSPSSGWRDVPFVRMIEAALDVPVTADNDVKACAWAEAHFGLALGYENFFWMTISTGIGGAAVEGGKVVVGKRGMAGEIGHLVVNPGGEQCACGNRGCLEAEAAGPAWRRKALRLIEDDPASALARLGTDAVDAEVVARLARSGDESCLAVVRNVGVMLARGIAAVENILDPQAIVVGGGVAGSLDILLPVISESLPSLILAGSERAADIRPSMLGYDAALVGAAALALYPY